MKWIRCFTLAKGLLLALLAAGLSTGLASAQDCEGTFTLPFEARWGLATLAPGNYSFRLEATGSLHFVTIRHGLKAAAMVVEDGRNTYESAAGPSALIAVRSGGKYRITRLRLAEAGLVLNYLPPKAERQILAQGSGLTRHVPILMAAR